MSSPAPDRNTAQVQDRDPFHIFEKASSTRWTGCAKVRPKPCTTGDRATAGHSAKITLSEAIAYVDWAQTGVDACFYGSGCSGLRGWLPGILPETHDRKLRDQSGELDCSVSKRDAADGRVWNRHRRQSDGQHHQQDHLVK